MRPTRLSSPLLLLAIAALTGCALTGCAGLGGTGTGDTSTGSGTAPPTNRGGGTGSQVTVGADPIVVGPGPRSPYTVQPQPAPGSCHYRYQGRYPLPDPGCTPGAVNPRVTQADLAGTICRAGYSSSIRPPAEITDREKAADARSYGYAGPRRTAEYDHLISLELGGDPNDPRNLWVEPNDRTGATGTRNSKDTVEDAAHTAVCSGRITLAEAQQGIATDWPALGRQLGLTLP